MKKKLVNKNVILFLVFFLLVIGNSAYINSTFQNKIEFVGLALLLIATFIKQKKNFETLKKLVINLFFCIILTLGALHYNISIQSTIMIFLSSLLLLNYAEFSNVFITDNKQIKVIGDALLCGMLFNSIIGIFTGTLGLSFNSKEAIFAVLFQSGVKVKNYCGGIWLVTFISYYIYYYRNGKLNKHLLRFFLLGILLIFSGSKGACFLAVIFVLCLNIKKILNFKERQAFVFYSLLIIILLSFSLYIYNNVFINISTYAYRMRGINKIIDIISHDFNRFVYGFSDIAYADTGYDYTINMRNFLGWEASVEMAYVNIIIKSGFLGYVVYYYIFRKILKKAKKLTKKEKNIAYCIVVVMLFSGFTETYFASIHYVIGPALYCLVNGIVYDKKCLLNSN